MYNNNVIHDERCFKHVIYLQTAVESVDTIKYTVLDAAPAYKCVRFNVLPYPRKLCDQKRIVKRKFYRYELPPCQKQYF